MLKFMLFSVSCTCVPFASSKWTSFASRTSLGQSTVVSTSSAPSDLHTEDCSRMSYKRKTDLGGEHEFESGKEDEMLAHI